MFVKKTFRFRLKPSRAQEMAFRQFSGACRWIYNRGLAQRKEVWEKERRSVSLYEQNNSLVALKNCEETTWLKDIHSQILQQALGDLDKAFTHFFRRVGLKQTPGYPRFKHKGERDAFRYPQGVKADGSRVFLPKIGWVRFRKSREIEGVLKQATVIREGKGWYVCFSCEWEQPAFLFPTEPDIVGVDLGLERFATLAHQGGFREVENPRFLGRDLAHLRYLGRELSRKTFKSKNWQKAKAKLQTFYARIRWKRQDFLHKLSTAIVKSHDVIVVECLKVKRLMETSRRSLARSMGDAGWRQFLQMVKYKCEYLGKRLIEAGEYFPSTQLCSQCGKGNPLPLSQRIYQCSCGLEIHRDRNAALNLRTVGTTAIKACGAAS